ncbi:hypothetical protein [Salipiger mucosus]|uniref:GlsB/YeaQ/YmgE family stress response membrane protein n=1 Tax=Salipiger mucosus DSM 16094 TaxID=1123237 RepID=S9QDY9_9RHOB|nr:hypothetical protein [Salipiger mucosus]EPX79641.1 hypothetical protein Salmuc_05582 [Salipiger mucosus DSM 16094]
MEEFFEALSTIMFVLLILVGLASGAIAGVVAGRNKALYLVMGVVGAVALPFVLAALGIGVLAAGGAIAILMAALVGAAVLLMLVALLSRR